MKKILLFALGILVFLDSGLSLIAQVRVRGYHRKDGTYVRPHTRSSPNSTTADNYSARSRSAPVYQPSTSSIYPRAASPRPAPQAPVYVPPPATTVARTPLPSTPKDPNLKPVFEGRFDSTDQILEFQKKEAQKGSQYAQFALGMRYLNGSGIPQDVEEGKKWLEKAAAQGHFRAKDKLREMQKRPRVPER